jgi:hypothetical protein
VFTVEIMRILIISLLLVVLLTIFDNGLHPTILFMIQGYSLEDLWLIDCNIPLKNKSLVELIRSAVYWVI